MIVTCQQMQQLEEAAFARGVSAEALMDEAGRGIADVVRQFCPKPGLLVLYLGKGNNAGDALVAARELRTDGWRIVARLSGEPAQMKPLPLMHWRALEKVVSTEVEATLATHRGPLVMLDGLLGIGATGPLRGSLRSLAAEMNALRRTRHAMTIAMDIPSGLDGDTGQASDDAVIADITVTIGEVKKGLLVDEATANVGRLAMVPLRELTTEAAGPEIITAPLLRTLLPKRSFDLHKGQAGRAAIIAGSPGFLGAAVLASLGALRGGAGLITLFAKPEAYEWLAMKLPPEIMVKRVKDYRDALKKADVIAIGPGLGFEHEEEVIDLLVSAKQPIVVDADALTILARHSKPAMQGPRLLTPHPGEMASLTHEEPVTWVALNRAGEAEAFAAQHGLTLLLKGARTVIATPRHSTRYNTTGTPGMACGGMGDVLSGLCAALIAQGMTLHDAASAGSWLLGRAAEHALHNRSEEALSATDVADHLGQAFVDLKQGAY